MEFHSTSVEYFIDATSKRSTNGKRSFLLLTPGRRDAEEFTRLHAHTHTLTHSRTAFVYKDTFVRTLPKGTFWLPVRGRHLQPGAPNTTHSGAAPVFRIVFFQLLCKFYFTSLFLPFSHRVRVRPSVPNLPIFQSKRLYHLLFLVTRDIKFDWDARIFFSALLLSWRMYLDRCLYFFCFTLFFVQVFSLRFMEGCICSMDYIVGTDQPALTANWCVMCYEVCNLLAEQIIIFLPRLKFHFCCGVWMESCFIFLTHTHSTGQLGLLVCLAQFMLICLQTI